MKCSLYLAHSHVSSPVYKHVITPRLIWKGLQLSVCAFCIQAIQIRNDINVKCLCIDVEKQATQRVANESDNSLISPFRHDIISLLLAFQPHGLTVLGSPKLGSKIFEKKIEEKASVLCFKNIYTKCANYPSPHPISETITSKRDTCKIIFSTKQEILELKIMDKFESLKHLRNP